MNGSVRAGHMLRALLLAGLALGAAGPVLIAQDGNEDGDRATLEIQSATAIRLAIADGVIRYAKDGKEARLRVEWPYLPLDSTLFARAVREGIRPYQIRIRNGDLRSGRWSGRLSAEHRELLRRALLVCDLASLGDMPFRAVWLEEGGYARENYLKSGGPIAPHEVYALLRDHNRVRALLMSDGGYLILDVRGAHPRMTFPRAIDTGIDWRLGVYAIPVSREASEGTLRPVETPDPCEREPGERLDFYYRFEVAGVPREIAILFPREAKTTANIRIGAQLRGLAAVAESWSAVTDIPLESSLENTSIADSLRALEFGAGKSTLESILSIVGGGATLSEVVTRGVLSGTSDLSVVTGGLLADGDGGEELEYVVGVNWEGPWGVPRFLGVLLGVTPEADPTVFLGASLRVSALMAGLGFRVAEIPKVREGAAEEAPETTQELDLQPALVLSIDVPRVLGAKRQREAIVLDRAAVGGGLGSVDRYLAGRLGLLRWSLTKEAGLGDTLPDGTDVPRVVRLEQVTDATGASLEDERRGAVVVLAVQAADRVRLRFVPAGEYIVRNLPGALRLKDPDGEAVGDTVRVSGVDVKEVSWVLGWQR